MAPSVHTRSELWSVSITRVLAICTVLLGACSFDRSGNDISAFDGGELVDATHATPADASPRALFCEADCSGCCDRGQCLSGTTDQSCGADGARCIRCPEASTCEQGECRVDPNALWNMIAISATINPLTTTNRAWDSNDTLPDPYLEVEAIVNGEPLAASTSWASNTLMPEWNAVILNAVRTATARVVRYRVLDIDPGGSDFIGECAIVLPASAFGAPIVTVNCERDIERGQAGFDLQLRVERAE